MRVPTVLLSCKLAALAAVILMTAGTVLKLPEVRAWALLVSVLAAALAICVAIHRATEAVKAYVHRWSLETFKHGFQQGVEQGRQMEAAERMSQIARTYRDN